MAEEVISDDDYSDVSSPDLKQSVEQPRFRKQRKRAKIFRNPVLGQDEHPSKKFKSDNEFDPPRHIALEEFDDEVEDDGYYDQQDEDIEESAESARKRNRQLREGLHGRMELVGRAGSSTRSSVARRQSEREFMDESDKFLRKRVQSYAPLNDDRRYEGGSRPTTREITKECSIVYREGGRFSSNKLYERSHASGELIDKVNYARGEPKDGAWSSGVESGYSSFQGHSTDSDDLSPISRSVPSDRLPKNQYPVQWRSPPHPGENSRISEVRSYRKRADRSTTYDRSRADYEQINPYLSERSQHQMTAHRASDSSRQNFPVR